MLTLSSLTVGFAQEKSKETIGINLEYMDKTVKPSDDFFRFVNGNWLDKNEIPADRTRWGSFDELREKTDKDMMLILKEALNNPSYTAETDQGKALNLYRTIMDTVTRNKQGIKPLKPYLEKINAVKDVADLKKLLIEMETQGGVGFFGVGVGTDAKNSNRNVVNVGLGSLGLPDRDYYVSEDKDSKEKREKYHAHIIKMMSYLGEKPAQAIATADRVLTLEIAMATPRLDRVERRDRRKTYNPMTIAELQNLTPTINWNEYLQGVGLPIVDTIIVSQPRYMTALETIFKENKVEDWKAYMRWTLLNRYAGLLSTEIGNANWQFYGKTLTGAIKQRPFDERALQSVNGSFGEALGKIYVEKMFPPEAKEKARKMIDNLFLAYENRINNLPWMAKSTKDNAIAKLKKFNVKIGYPDKWKDYSKVTIIGPKDGGTYFDNSKTITKWRNDENFAKLNKPVDKTE